MKIIDLFEKKSALTAWAILYTDDKVILGRRAPGVNNPNQWNFFGGLVDAGETAAQAVVRELEEETGFKMQVSAFTEIASINGATYFAAKIQNPGNLRTTAEINKIRGFKLTELPDELHAKTSVFFDKLDLLFAK